MNDVERRIMEFAIREYPGQFDEGIAYFKMQVDAYRACEAFYPPDIPAATLRGIKRRSAAIDGDDYVGQLRTIEQEVAAYRLLHGDEDADIPRGLRQAILKSAKLHAGIKAGYHSQHSLYRKEIVAYRRLQQLHNSDLPEKELAEALRIACDDHPGDFARQYEEICQHFTDKATADH